MLTGLILAVQISLATVDQSEASPPDSSNSSFIFDLPFPSHFLESLHLLNVSLPFLADVVVPEDPPTPEFNIEQVLSKPEFQKPPSEFRFDTTPFTISPFEGPKGELDIPVEAPSLKAESNHGPSSPSPLESSTQTAATQAKRPKTKRRSTKRPRVKRSSSVDVLADKSRLSIYRPEIIRRKASLSKLEATEPKAIQFRRHRLRNKTNPNSIINTKDRLAKLRLAHFRNATKISAPIQLDGAQQDETQDSVQGENSQQVAYIFFYRIHVCIA